MMKEFETLNITVQSIIYHNEENGYTILRGQTPRSKLGAGLISVKGILPETYPGAKMQLTGNWEMDKKYGEQFSVTGIESIIPADVNGILCYLSSGLIKGVGAMRAKEIVNVFKEDTLTIIEQHPERLLEVPGIGPKRQEKIVKSYKEHIQVRELVMFLQKYGISTTYAVRIIRIYQDKWKDVLESNPYKLAEDIHGIGFKTADMMAQKLGLDAESPERIAAGITYTLRTSADTDGHVFLTVEELLERSIELLGVPIEKTRHEIFQMKEEGALIIEGEKIYLPVMYWSEKGVASRLMTLQQAPTARPVTITVQEIEDDLGVQYEEKQRRGLSAAIENKVSILTGGPGTGKTMTTGGILHAFEESGFRVGLLAPTGRAAKKMSEATGREARTIHRALGFNTTGGFKHNENNKLEYDAMIVDESSMIDTHLMYALLKATPDKCRIVFVGDVDQLPSVGPGAILFDMIESGVIPVTRLSVVFRQAQESNIIKNAHLVNDGKMIEVDNSKKSDFFLSAISEKTDGEKRDLADVNEEIAKKIVYYATQSLPKYYNLTTDDIQILSPMRKTPVGVDSLNEKIQGILCPAKGIHLQFGHKTFHIGDKVMQTRNNYDKDVFNGDIGKVENIDIEDKELTVNFDGYRVVYDQSDLDELTLAYAITIHKAQGSEFPVVVIPMTTSHYTMLQRNLLYTAITRAKKAILIIGTRRAIHIAISKKNTSTRNTTLREFLIEKEEAA